MAFSTPATFVAGNVLTAAQLNTYLRDNVAWLATDSPAARAYNNANQAIGTGTNTALLYNSERFDNAAVHSTSVNTSRLTVPSGGAGKYLMGGCLTWAANATGVRQAGLWGNSSSVLVQETRSNNSADTVSMSLVTVVQLTVADFVEFVTFQNSGGNLDATMVANHSNEFWCFWYRT